MPTTSNTKPSYPLTKQEGLKLVSWNHMLSKLATEVRQQKRKEEDAFAVISNHMKNNPNFSGEASYDRLDYLLSIQTPHNAINDIMNYATTLYQRYGNNMTFPHYIHKDYYILFIALLILGANGRGFIFARQAVGKCANLKPMSIQRFLASLLRRKIIYCVRKGVRFKKASWYQLANNEWWDAWQNIGQALCIATATETSTEILSNFAWLFDTYNIMNNSGYVRQLVQNQS